MKIVRNELGQALVEMALVLPILIFRLFGIVEMTIGLPTQSFKCSCNT